MVVRMCVVLRDTAEQRNVIRETWGWIHSRSASASRACSSARQSSNFFNYGIAEAARIFRFSLLLVGMMEVL